MTSLIHEAKTCYLPHPEYTIERNKQGNAEKRGLVSFPPMWPHGENKQGGPGSSLGSHSCDDTLTKAAWEKRVCLA